MSVLQKAYICPYREGRPVLGEKTFVQFNPSEISVEEAIGADTVAGDMEAELANMWKGCSIGWQQPVNTSTAGQRKKELTLSAMLFFNTLESLNQTTYEDVRGYIQPLYRYTNKTAEKQGKLEQIYFVWGSIAVAGILTQMSVRYTMFAPDGIPVRAQVTISIRGDYCAQQEPAGIQSKEDQKAVSPQDWRSIVSKKGNPRL